MAIDREAYVAGVHPGEIPTANALPADSPGYLPELDEEYAYDPDGAKALLARRVTPTASTSSSTSLRTVSATSKRSSPTGRRSA